MKKYIKKADIILFVVLVVLGIACTVGLAVTRTSGSTVVIERNGELYATYSLNENRTIEISADATGSDSNSSNSTVSPQSNSLPDSVSSSDSDTQKEVCNTVVIKDGTVYMESASCHNQVCVKHSAISLTGESIICLPNKIIVRIEGSKSGGGYDAITQ